MYRVILLDIDGTLLDFKKSQEVALEKTFQKHHVVLTEELLVSYDKINHGLWKQHEKGEITKDDIIHSRFKLLFEQEHLDADVLGFEKDYQNFLGSIGYYLPNAEEVVQYLSKKYELYIVTNGLKETQTTRIKDCGLDAYVKDVFISDEIGYQKPQKEFFECCFEKIGKSYKKEDYLIIGDTLSSDILGGNNAGIDTCWYNPQKTKPDIEVSIQIEIEDLTQLYEVL